ncbi:MAG: site-2 protease family protein [Planctomycetota bacterium]
MPVRFQLGRLFGTDIYAAPGFFALLLLYFVAGATSNVPVSNTAVFCIAVVLSLLVHEFGHVFAVRRLLRKESMILLWGMGGLCVYEPGGRPGQRVAIALMGPAFEVALGAVAVAAWLWAPPAVPLLRYFVFCMVWINVVWVVLNLLPILPLDGGQALLAAIESRAGRARARAILRRVSLFGAAACAGIALHLQIPILALVAVFLFLHNLGGGAPRV